MQVLSLCKTICPEKIPITPMNFLGEGADGEVFEYMESSDKVIKFCILYDSYSKDLESEYNSITKSLSFLEDKRPPICALVFKHEFMSKGTREVYFGKQDFILYYYIMEKLFKISADEKKVFHSLLSHEDSGIAKNFSNSMILDMLSGMSRGLDFDINKVILFYNSIKTSDIQHLDIHARNIMKDREGNFKLIDFDRMKIGG